MAKITRCTHRKKEKYRVIGLLSGKKAVKYFTLNADGYAAACHFLYECENEKFRHSNFSQIDNRKQFYIDKLLQYYIGWKVEEFERNKGAFQTIREVIQKCDKISDSLKNKKIDDLTRAELESLVDRPFYLWVKAALAKFSGLFGIEADKLPKPKRVKKNRADHDVYKPTVSEVSALMNACEHPREIIFVFLCAYLGLRVGEALVVTWEDVNVERSELSVNKHLVRSRIIEGTKGRFSRVIPFNDDFIEILAVVDKKYKYLIGNKHRKSSFLSRGTFYNKFYPPLFKRAKVGFNPKDLRHFYGTNSLKSGVELRDVTKRMGHSSSHITAKYYLYSNTDGKDNPQLPISDKLILEKFK